MNREGLIMCILLLGLVSCSRSGRHKSQNEPEGVKSHPGGNVVSMEKIDGVYQIPVDIDGVPMHFIFDTGAGMISISETEAIFLYKQHKLSNDDISGSAQFSDANGNISEGTLIILKEVKIGNRTLENIQASVVGNLKAPLLIGQSALEKFGKVTIDYSRMEISFE